MPRKARCGPLLNQVLKGFRGVLNKFWFEQITRWDSRAARPSCFTMYIDLAAALLVLQNHLHSPFHVVEGEYAHEIWHRNDKLFNTILTPILCGLNSSAIIACSYAISRELSGQVTCISGVGIGLSDLDVWDNPFKNHKYFDPYPNFG